MSNIHTNQTSFVPEVLLILLRVGQEAMVKTCHNTTNIILALSKLEDLITVLRGYLSYYHTTYHKYRIDIIIGISSLCRIDSHVSQDLLESIPMCPRAKSETLYLNDVAVLNPPHYPRYDTRRRMS